MYNIRLGKAFSGITPKERELKDKLQAGRKYRQIKYLKKTVYDNIILKTLKAQW